MEKEARIEEMRGEQTLGYCFSLTDRAPGPGEYKYMTQGISQTGEMKIAFTILQYDDNAAIRTAALKMIADAKYSQ